MIGAGKKITGCLCLLLLIAEVFSQYSEGKYFISFTDKDNSPYSVDKPEEFLSERAIQRRSRYNIPVTVQDLPVNPHYIDSIRNAGLTVVNPSKWFNAVTVVADSARAVLLDSIKQFSFVQSLEKTYPYTAKNGKNPAEKAMNETAYNNAVVDEYYGGGYGQIAMLNGHYLHMMGYKGKGVIIAVTDAGFNNVNTLEAFDSLRLQNRLLAIKDFVDYDTNVFHSSTHGLKVLSIISANVPGFFVGAAPEADIVLLRTENPANEYLIEEDNWVAGAEYADSIGADIINISLGYSIFYDTAQSHTYLDMDGNTTRISIGADIASSKGMLVVVSAGNEGDDAWKYITAPADADSVLTVGAVDNNRMYAGFSSIGPTCDGRIKPDVAALGNGNIILTSGGLLTMGSGTSYAAPVISGLAACLWQAYPHLNNQEIISLLHSFGSQADNPDNLLGYGLPDFKKAFNFYNEAFYSLYPNPYESELFLDFYSGKNQSLTYKVYDLLGKQVAAGSYPLTANNHYTVNLSSLQYLSRGIYILSVSFNGNLYKHKIFKS